MNTLTPFLYQFSRSEVRFASRHAKRFLKSTSPRCIHSTRCQRLETQLQAATDDVQYSSRLNPAPDDYNLTPFVDKCILILQAGSGGNGCVSFLREKYIAEGPANGGDGGTGGNLFVQAVRNCTSLNTIARKREYAAGNGGHGQGKSRGGKKGEDVLLQVPVGTVIREINRWDPVEAQIDLERQLELVKGEDEDIKLKLAGRWIYHPSLKKHEIPESHMLPALPPTRRSTLAASQPFSPIRLDLDSHMERPMLLAAGAMGGKGNPHFASTQHWKPKVATKGDGGMRIALALELKLVADVGLVGLPNAGKSTLLRAISNSRARVGSWAFTTLKPNIGTVVLDDYRGRPTHTLQRSRTLGSRDRFTIADIPGLIEEAHLNKGLGHEFLRHIERAQILAFVVDLSAGDATLALQALWKEVGEYQTVKERHAIEHAQRPVEWNRLGVFGSQQTMEPPETLFTKKDVERLPPLVMPSITSKPWFVVATKADLPETMENFLRLRSYVEELSAGDLPHPSGKKEVQWKGAKVIPISGIRGEGITTVVETVLDILEDGPRP